jgi:hypothetical protein
MKTYELLWATGVYLAVLGCFAIEFAMDDFYKKAFNDGSNYQFSIQQSVQQADLLVGCHGGKQ